MGKGSKERLKRKREEKKQYIKNKKKHYSHTEVSDECLTLLNDYGLSQFTNELPENIIAIEKQ